MMNMKAQSPFLIHHSAFIIHHFLQRLAFDDAHRRRGVDDAREAEAGGVVDRAREPEGGNHLKHLDVRRRNLSLTHSLNLLIVDEFQV
jgi:hypothetical protein